MITLYTAFAGVFSVCLPINSMMESSSIAPVVIEQIKNIVGLLVCVLTTVVYYGLWTMSPWGLWVGRIYYLISLFLSIICIIYILPKGTYNNVNVIFILSETWILTNLFQIDSSLNNSKFENPSQELNSLNSDLNPKILRNRADH